jgi:hypothetical protein
MYLSSLHAATSTYYIYLASYVCPRAATKVDAPYVEVRGAMCPRTVTEGAYTRIVYVSLYCYIRRTRI